METKSNIMGGMTAPEGTEFLKGSDNTLDYVVLGKSGPFKVAFRPLFIWESGTHGPMFGFRVRVYWGEEGSAPLHFKDILSMTMPAAKFTKITAYHASITGGFVLPIENKNPTQEAVVKALKKAGSIPVILAGISEATGVVVSAEMQAFIPQAYAKLIATVMDDKAAKGKVSSKGTVIAFKPKDKDVEDEY